MLLTWLMAFSILTSSKKSVSAKQLQRQLGLGSYKSAWHMAHRIRHCLTSGVGPLGGPGKVVELDESYVSVGKPKGGETHGRSLKYKAAIFGLVERGEGGKIKARVLVGSDSYGRYLGLYCEGSGSGTTPLANNTVDSVSWDEVA